MGGVLGAAHCVDVPFAFDNLDAPGVEVALGPEPPQALADQMHRAWVDFVTDGDPRWPVFRLDTRPAMVFDGESTVVNDPLRLPRSLWGSAQMVPTETTDLFSGTAGTKKNRDRDGLR